jgi:hypothetical protein
MPRPELLASLGPVMRILVDAAAEYQACADPDAAIAFDAVDWVRWLDVAVREAVANRGAVPIG